MLQLEVQTYNYHLRSQKNVKFHLWWWICSFFKKFLSVLLESEGEKETEGDLSDISTREMAVILRRFSPF